MGGVVKKKKETSISVLFIKYMFRLVGAIVGICVLMAFIFSMMSICKVIYPAYYAEQSAKEAAKKIEALDVFTKDLVPELCTYVVFDLDGNVIETDLEGQDVQRIWKTINNEFVPHGGYYNEIIKKQNGYYALRYRIMPEYRSPSLRKYLMNPQYLLGVATLILIIASVIFYALRFKKLMEKEMQLIIDVASKVQNQDLEFQVTLGKVKEINHVLLAIERMRNELQLSLKKQWHDTEFRKKQISQLAHDLKTPITIIKGNAELLEDTLLNDEQKECRAYISESAEQMQTYVGLMIEVNRSEKSYKPVFEVIKIKAFISEIVSQTKGLCVSKNIKCVINDHSVAKDFCADNQLLLRAMMNIVSNAIDFEPENGSITLHVENDEQYIYFKVIDNGPGFSKEGLKNAASQFFMEDQSRNSRVHYGLGLYMAENVASLFGGKLILANREDKQGAIVALVIDKNIQYNK